MSETADGSYNDGNTAAAAATNALLWPYISGIASLDIDAKRHTYIQRFSSSALCRLYIILHIHRVSKKPFRQFSCCFLILIFRQKYYVEIRHTKHGLISHLIWIMLLHYLTKDRTLNKWLLPSNNTARLPLGQISIYRLFNSNLNFTFKCSF